MTRRAQLQARLREPGDFVLVPAVGLIERATWRRAAYDAFGKRVRCRWVKPGHVEIRLLSRDRDARPASEHKREVVE